MIRVAFALLLTVTRARADTPDHHRLAHLLIGGGAVGVYALTATVGTNALSPDHCRWCVANALDRDVRGALEWNDHATASRLSDVSGYLMPAATATALLYASSRDGDRLLDDLIPLLEAGAYTEFAAEIIKISVARQRPYAHYDPTSPSSEDNLSFVSGHTTLAFSVATAAGMVAHRRHYRYEAAIWASGLTFAALTGYFRIAADAHYFTDVLAAAALGTAGGIAIPQLSGSLPDDLAIVPTTNGVAIAGAF